MHLKRRAERFLPDPRRVLIRPFIPLSQPHRITNVIARTLTMTDAEVDAMLADVMQEFSGRHINIERVFERHYASAKPFLLPTASCRDRVSS